MAATEPATRSRSWLAASDEQLGEQQYGVLVVADLGQSSAVDRVRPVQAREQRLPATAMLSFGTPRRRCAGASPTAPPASPHRRPTRRGGRRLPRGRPADAPPRGPRPGARSVGCGQHPAVADEQQHVGADEAVRHGVTGRPEPDRGQLVDLARHPALGALGRSHVKAEGDRVRYGTVKAPLAERGGPLCRRCRVGVAAGRGRR